MKMCLLATWLSLAASSGNVVHMFTISLDRFVFEKQRNRQSCYSSQKELKLNL